MKIFLLFYMCHFAIGLTHCYKTTVFFTFFHIKAIAWAPAGMGKRGHLASAGNVVQTLFNYNWHCSLEQKEPKSLPQDRHVSLAQNIPWLSCGRPAPRFPIPPPAPRSGSLQRSPRPHSAFEGAASQRKRSGKVERAEGKKRRFVKRRWKEDGEKREGVDFAPLQEFLRAPMGYC